MQDDRTARLNIPLPYIDNELSDDIQRLRDAFTTLDQRATLNDAKGIIQTSQLPSNLAMIGVDGKLYDSQIPTYVAQTDATGKIPASLLPAIAISQTFTAATQAAMLASTADVGDISIRTDLNQSFILSALPATTLNNWKELLTNPVVTVNGRYGAVTVAEAGSNSDITEIKGLSVALTVAQGGTGAKDAATARENLIVDRLSQPAGETDIYDPTKTRYIYISSPTSSNGWGAYDATSKAKIALPVESGGTGALNAADARTKLVLGYTVSLANPGAGIVRLMAYDDSGLMTLTRRFLVTAAASSSTSWNWGFAAELGVGFVTYPAVSVNGLGVNSGDWSVGTEGLSSAGVGGFIKNTGTIAINIWITVILIGTKL